VLYTECINFTYDEVIAYVPISTFWVLKAAEKYRFYLSGRSALKVIVRI
jgi:hypothetical protein